MSRSTISKRHHISESFVTEGTKSLRKLNLLEIEHGEPKGADYSKRPANIYTPKKLYNPEEVTAELKKLETKHGREKLLRAKKLAELVFEDNNLRTIDTLIELENKYGEPVMNDAATKIADKNADNPKRSAGYLINTIKGLAQERGL